MDNMMTAAVFRGPGVIETECRPIPACPPGGILIRVAACGICGSDVRNFSAGLKDGVTNQVMGHEIAGVVVESDCEKFPVDSRVALAPDVSCGECWYCKHGFVNLCQSHKMLGTHFPGGFAQYLAAPREVLEHGFVEPMPAGMAFEHAAFAETAAAVVACQKRVGITKGDTVLIIGDGPVGCLHIEVARAYGAERIILLGRDRLTLAESFAPDYLIDNGDPEAASAQIRNICGDIGPDVVICAVPTTAVQQQAVELVRKRGTVVIYGGVPKTAPMTELDSNLIHYGEITVTGAFSYPATGLADALEMIAKGAVHPEKYIGATVGLSEIVQGIDKIKSGQALKVMVDPWQDEEEN